MIALDALGQFHLLRPWWLLAILPAILVVYWLWRQKYQAKNWQQLIAPELLPYLLDGKTTRTHPFYILGLAFTWLVGTLALAGPSWEQRPVAVEKNQQAMVIMLDLSPSMLSEDIKPSRLVRARLKIADILKQRSDGFTALLVFAGDAHVVTPLTDDIKTINNLLPDLSPNIMPLQGSNTEAAIGRAIKLLQDASITQGDLLLVTDGVSTEAQDTITSILETQPNYRLSILGVGTTNPTPIPSSKGGFVRDNGKIVTTQLNSSELQSLAQHTGGLYRTISDTSADIHYLINAATPFATDTERVEREFDSWYDRGHWLVLLLLPIILYCFRRGVLLILCVIPILGMTPQSSHALSWDELWNNNDQLGHTALEQQKPAEAAELFDNSDWKGTAQYRAGNYTEAAKEFAKNPSAQGHYNRGNALAKAGQLDEAMKAYNQALQQDANLDDAKKNLALLEQLKKQQQNQEKNQNSDDPQKNDQEKSDQEKDQQEGSNSDQQQQNQQQDQQSSADNQQSSDQQNQEQQNQEQQNQDQQEQNQDPENGQKSSASAEQNPDEESMSEQGSSAAGQTDATESASQSSESNRTEQQAQASSAAGQEQQTAEEQALSQVPDDGLTEEQRQAMEQWLRRVPDEPGLLLKNKFRDQYQKRRMKEYNGDWQAPENGADERW